MDYELRNRILDNVLMYGCTTEILMKDMPTKYKLDEIYREYSNLRILMKALKHYEND